VRIFLDYRRVWTSYGGGSTTFALGLLDGFKAITNHKITVGSSGHNHDFLVNFCKNSSIKVEQLEQPGIKECKLHHLLQKICYRFGLKKIYVQLTNFLWRKSTAKISSDYDFLYTPTDLTAYNFKIPTLCSLHDIQQVHFPQFFSKNQLLERFITFNACVENVSFMQASSFFMQSDFMKYFPILKKENIVVIPEGVNIEQFMCENDLNEIKQKYHIPDEFIYYPGQLWPHKDHLTVLKAIKYLRDKYGVLVPLVITGAQYSASDRIFKFIDQNSLNNLVHYYGVLPYHEVRAIFRASTFVITSTLYESSSLPIREAAAANTAIIASDTEPNIEVSKTLDINLFKTGDWLSLVSLLNKIWGDKELRKEQILQNNKAVEEYRWEKIAKQYIVFMENNAK